MQAEVDGKAVRKGTAIMPGRRYGAMSLWYMAACFSSLIRIMIRSAILGGLGGGHDRQARGLRLLPALGALVQRDGHVACPSLRRFSACAWPWRAVAHDGDLLAHEELEVAVLRVKHLCHIGFLLKFTLWKAYMQRVCARFLPVACQFQMPPAIVAPSPRSSATSARAHQLPDAVVRQQAAAAPCALSSSPVSSKDQRRDWATSTHLARAKMSTRRMTPVALRRARAPPCTSTSWRSTERRASSTLHLLHAR